MGSDQKISEEHLKAKIEKALKNDKTMQANKYAKELEKGFPSEKNSRIRCRVSLKRAMGLYHSEMEKEAFALLDSCKDRYSQFSELIKKYEQKLRLEEESPKELIKLLKAETEIPQAKINKALQKNIGNPKNLLEFDILEQDDILYQEALIINELFEKVTTRKVTPEELSQLKQIRSGSPLLPWKLVIRAIHWYYQGDVEKMMKNLQAISEKSIPAKLIRILPNAINEDIETNTSSLSYNEKKLVKSISQSSKLLKKLDNSFKSTSINRLTTLFHKVAKFLEKREENRLDDFIEKFAYELILHPYPDIWDLTDTINDKYKFKFLCAFADGIGSPEPTISVSLWIRAMEKLNWQEKSRAYIKIAILIKIFKILGQGESGFLPPFISAYEEYVSPIMEKIENDYRILNNVKDTFDQARIAAIVKIIEISQDNKIFAELINILESDNRLVDKKRHERLLYFVANRWKDEHPDNPKPIRVLAKISMDRGAHKKTDRFIAKLKEVDGLNPEIVQLRINNYRNNIDKYLKNGNYHLIDPVLEDLKNTAETANMNTDYLINFIEAVCAKIKDNPDKEKKIREKLDPDKLVNRFLNNYYDDNFSINLFESRPMRGEKVNIKKFIPGFLEAREKLLYYGFASDEILSRMGFEFFIKREPESDEVSVDKIFDFMVNYYNQISDIINLYLTVLGMKSEEKHQIWFLYFRGVNRLTEEYNKGLDMIIAAKVLGKNNHEVELLKFIENDDRYYYYGEGQEMSIKEAKNILQREKLKKYGFFGPKARQKDSSKPDNKRQLNLF